MINLTEFLLARIAEDEAAARRGGRHNAPGVFANDNYGCLLVDPARVLAECDAKRGAIYAAWSDHLRIEGEWGMGRSQAALEAISDFPEVVIALGRVYADHEGYRAEWA